MFILYKNEWLKLRRQYIGLIVLCVPILGVLLGTFSFNASYEMLVHGENEWYAFWTQVTFFYGLFIYPILTGIFAAFICRSEHQNGGWKHLLSLPVPRYKVFFAKLLVLFTLLFMTQVVLLLGALIIGMQATVQANVPFSFLLSAVTAGWFASFPLAIIQLWISIKTKSFALPLGANIFFVLGSLVAMVLGIELLYPWAHPSISMASPEEEANISQSSIFTIVTIYFLCLVMFCSWHFERREITS